MLRANNVKTRRQQFCKASKVIFYLDNTWQPEPTLQRPRRGRKNAAPTGLESKKRRLSSLIVERTERNVKTRGKRSGEKEKWTGQAIA
jgi:hypothetical protein